MISFRYNPNHIIALKVDYQHATMLRSMNKVGPSIEIFKDIERVIVDVLRQKRAAGELMQKEADDEKFPLLRKVYGDMKGIH